MESNGKNVLQGDLYAMESNGLKLKGVYEKECPQGDVLICGLSVKPSDIARAQEGQKALGQGFQFLTLSPEAAPDGQANHLELRFENAASFQRENVVAFLKVFYFIKSILFIFKFCVNSHERFGCTVSTPRI